MESRGYDPTLPLDFDGSTNMTDLPEVTLSNGPSDHDIQDSVSASSGTGLMLPSHLMAKSNSGRMSPVRGRTMKEYDQQITDLKKENFSLKLRIYFLEERMLQKYGDGEDVFKTNIELKVNVQSLKKELEDKQELLRKASQAMEMLTSSQQSDIDVVRKSLEEQHHKYTEELRSDLQKALQDAEDARDELEAGRDKMNQLEMRLQQLEMEQQQTHLNAQKMKDTIEQNEREISALQLESDSHIRSLEDLQRLLQEAKAQRDAAQQALQQMEKDLQRRGRDVEQLSTALKDTSMIDGQSFLAPTHLQDVVDDQHDKLSKLEGKVAELENQLRKKDDLIAKLEESLREKDKAWKEASNRLEQLTTELEQEKQLGNRRDKTIQGLVCSLHKKEKEVTSAKAKLSKSETALKTTRAELHEAEMANHQEKLQQLNDQLEESESSNCRLQTQLSEANAQVENMIKSLGKKEGELAGFREQLQQANLALKRSEEALEGLQEQLEKERNQAHTRFDKQAQEYQRTLEDYMHQLESKDTLMAHMTSQMHAKDQQLTALMDLLTDENNKGQKALLQRLEDDLNKSSCSTQSALEVKQAELDKKARELREVRQALYDKGRELEQANLQLLEKQEELERVEMRKRQQTEVTAQLSNALAKAQSALEEALDRHAQALQEKDTIVQRLQKALAEKERMVEELTRQSPSVDQQQQQLRAQLREKDQLIQELQTECVQASLEKEQTARTTRAHLQEKEDEIQALSKKFQKELMNRDQEIQQLTANLGKKDLELQALEARLNAAEEQHREAVQTMRKMLAEKDKTIEALVDSIGEKERLLRRSQQNLTEDAKAQLAEMDTLLAENSHLKRLLREKEEALEEESRQRKYMNQETNHTSYHETITHSVESVQVYRLLEEQVREMQALNELLRQDRHELFTSLNTQRQSEGNSRDEAGKTSDATLQAELSAVSALRQRLQEGVERNQQLHRSLLGHTGRHTDQLTSGESSLEGDHHHHHLHPHQQQHSGTEQDGCPSISSSCGSNKNSPLLAGESPGDGATQAAGHAGAYKTNTLAVQTSPFLTHTLFAEGGPLARSGGLDPQNSRTYSGAGEGRITAQVAQSFNRPSSQEHLQPPGLSRDPSQDSVSSATSLSTAQLSGMSSAVLRDLVSQLQEDLIAAAQHNAMLQQQLEGRNQSQAAGSGEGSSQQTEGGASCSVAELQAQVESLQDKLKLKDEEAARLREHLGIPSPSSGCATPIRVLKTPDLEDQVLTLHQQVKDMNKANSALKMQVGQSTPTDREPREVFKPQVLASLAAEVERLRAENLRINAQRMAGEGAGVVREVSLGSDTCDGNGAANSQEGASPLWGRNGQHHPADSMNASQSMTMSPQFPTELYSQEFSRNTNRHTDSSTSQFPSFNQLESFSRSGSQLSQMDSEWAPRLMGGEGQGGSKPPWLAKVKLPSSDSACGQPMVNVGRKLQDAQEQVKSLEDRLLATEGTVRYMSQRLRHYRSLLQAAKGGNTQAGLSSCGLPRSRSETCLLSQPRLSLSLSCNNLHEASQCSGRGMGASAALGSGADLSALLPGNRTEEIDFQDPRFIANQIKALKERYVQDLEERKRELRQVAKQPSAHQEEDGGSNLSQALPPPMEPGAREAMRREMAPEPDRVERHTQGGKGVVGASDNTTVTSEVSSSSGSEWPFSTLHHTTASTMPGDQCGNSMALTSPQEMTFSITLGEDLPDSTVMDNLTYSSFSESILPLGPSQGHPDSAWSSPPGLSRLGKHAGAAAAGRRDQQSSGMQEGMGAGDEAVCDGNGADSTMQLNSAGEEGSQLSESSRLKARVVVLTNMNRTLREELSVYDTLCRSMGVQVSVEGGSGESSGEESCDGEMRLLQLHLAELKKLRSRMEQLDTEAHNAAQMTSLLNDQHIRRIAELEAALAQLREKLAQQQMLASQRQTTIVEHERTLAETKVVREQQERELELLRENLAALQECEAQRAQQQEAEVAELQQQVQVLRGEAAEARQQARELEEELEESQQRRHSYDVRFSESQQHLRDLEAQLGRAKRRVKSLEADLFKSRQASQELESHLAEAKHQQAQLETGLAEAEKRGAGLEKELAAARESVRSLEEELGTLRRQKEDLAASLQAEKQRGEKLELELQQAAEERQRLEAVAAESGAVREECQQQQQRAQHYQERMAHYEQCMRDYQHRVQDCETQVQQLQLSLQSCQSKEHDAESKLRQALSHVHHLQNQLQDAESRARTNESIAHRADTLARTLEGRLRELEAKVKEAEDRVRESEYELRVSQSTSSEINISMETLKRDLSERSTKLKKRDAQLKKLVEEYKKVLSTQKETSQLNQTLKTEIKMYESMHCQTEVSHDKKEELMRQLLSELSQTRRLAEDLITRLEHNKRNDSPASTGGPEAADGRPSPEPRDGLHHMLAESSILRIHTDSHNSTTDSHASSISEPSEARNSESPLGSGLLGSEGSEQLGSSDVRPKTLVGATSPQTEVSRSGSGGHGLVGGRGEWPGFAEKAGGGGSGVGGQKGVEDLGPGHLRSYSHPTSLKYWQDRPNPNLGLPAGMPRVEVSSDMRRLFAISGLEGYEKLRRENDELLATLSSMQARMTERLKSFSGVSMTESVEYSTLRELQMSAQNLRICAEEEGRLLNCFWLTQLPPLNARGEFYDPKLVEENENLKVELRKQKSRYDLLAHTVREQQERLHATNALRKKWETTLYKQLSHTNRMLERSKENFDEAGLVPSKQKSPRKALAQPIKDKN